VSTYNLNTTPARRNDTVLLELRHGMPELNGPFDDLITKGTGEKSVHIALRHSTSDLRVPYQALFPMTQALGLSSGALLFWTLALWFSVSLGRCLEVFPQGHKARRRQENEEQKRTSSFRVLRAWPRCDRTSSNSGIPFTACDLARHPHSGSHPRGATLRVRGSTSTVPPYKLHGGADEFTGDDSANLPPSSVPSYVRSYVFEEENLSRVSPDWGVK